MTAQTSPNFFEFNLAKNLGVPPKKVVKLMVKSLGELVKKGEVIAVQKTAFKKKTFLAPVAGVLDSLTEEGILKIKKPKT